MAHTLPDEDSPNIKNAVHLAHRKLKAKSQAKFDIKSSKLVNDESEDDDELLDFNKSVLGDPQGNSKA